MNRTIIGRLAAGTAAALCLTSAPVALASTAGAASTPSTAQTDAQSRATLVGMVDLLIAKGARDGLLLSGAESSRSDIDGSRYLQWKASVAVDPRRGTVREVGDIERGAVAADLYLGPESAYCAGGRVALPAGKPAVFVVRPGVGRWQKLPVRSFPTSAQLRVLDRKGARWERTADKHASSAGVLRGGSLVRALLDDLTEGSFGTTRTLGAAVRTPTSDGSLVVVPYSSGDGRTSARRTGEIRATASVHGALTGLSVVEKGSGRSDVTTYTVRFGARQVPTPAKSSAVSKRRMAQACAAVAVPDRIEWVSASVASGLNSGARTEHRSVKPSDIRESVDWYLSGRKRPAIRVSSIRYGVQIVGRHKLLKHPVVWTVFVRNGKAVAHRVR